MNRRDMMKLASLIMLPVMPRAAVASSDSKGPPLRYKVFTVTRPGLNRDVPPGKEPLMWVANSATLMYGEKDAEGNLRHACTWGSLFWDKGAAGSIPRPESTGDTRCRRKNEASDYAGKIEQPMAQAVPKSNSRSHFHCGSAGRQ